MKKKVPIVCSLRTFTRGLLVKGALKVQSVTFNVEKATRIFLLRSVE